MLEAMRQNNIEGVADARKFEVLRENFDFEAKRIETETQEIAELRADLRVRQTALLKECLAETSRLSHSAIPALVAARNELELPIAADVYFKISQGTQPKIDAQLNDFIKSLGNNSPGAENN